MEHYVTLFDCNFLPQGLALIESLELHAGNHRLWVLCLDDRTRQILDELHKSNVRTVPLADVETSELLAVKPGRTRAEYAWTLTPFTPRIVFERDSSAKRVTYLDADLFLFRSPNPIFKEFENSGKSVLITKHAYDPEYDQSATSGRFCVQFMTFARGESEHVRKWWEERCLEWCFNRQEEGKFGDQKYLDDWPERFAEHVHVMKQEEAIQAPWNARRFPYSDAIAWHFHGLRIQGRHVIWTKNYAIPESVDLHIYAPYISILKEKLKILGIDLYQEAPESLKKSLGLGLYFIIKRAAAFIKSFKRRRILRMYD